MHNQSSDYDFWYIVTLKCLTCTQPINPVSCGLYLALQPWNSF